MTYKDKANMDIESQRSGAFQHPIVPSEVTNWTQSFSIVRILWKTGSLEVPSQSCEQMQSELPLFMNLLSHIHLKKRNTTVFLTRLHFFHQPYTDLKEYIKHSTVESHLDLFVARYAVLTENESQDSLFY